MNEPGQKELSFILEAQLGEYENLHCTLFHDLPLNARKYIDLLFVECQTSVLCISAQAFVLPMK